MSRPRIISFWLLAMLLLLISPVGATTHYSDAPEPCQIIGDTVRFGLYLQWVAIVLATIVAPSQTGPAWIGAMIVSFSVVVSLLSRSGSNTLLGVNLMIALWETLIWFVGVAPLGLPTFNNPDSMRILLSKICLMFICVTSSAVVDSRYYPNAGWHTGMLKFRLFGMCALSEHIDIKMNG
jgi:hypothetical protein